MVEEKERKKEKDVFFSSRFLLMLFFFSWSSFFKISPFSSAVFPPLLYTSSD